MTIVTTSSHIQQSIHTPLLPTSPQTTTMHTHNNKCQHHHNHNKAYTKQYCQNHLKHNKACIPDVCQRHHKYNNACTPEYRQHHHKCQNATSTQNPTASPKLHSNALRRTCSDTYTRVHVYFEKLHENVFPCLSARVHTCDTCISAKTVKNPYPHFRPR